MRITWVASIVLVGTACGDAEGPPAPLAPAAPEAPAAQEAPAPTASQAPAFLESAATGLGHCDDSEKAPAADYLMMLDGVLKP